MVDFILSSLITFAPTVQPILLFLDDRFPNLKRSADCVDAHVMRIRLAWTRQCDGAHCAQTIFVNYNTSTKQTMTSNIWPHWNGKYNFQQNLMRTRVCMYVMHHWRRTHAQHSVHTLDIGSIVACDGSVECLLCSVRLYFVWALIYFGNTVIRLVNSSDCLHSYEHTNTQTTEERVSQLGKSQMLAIIYKLRRGCGIAYNLNREWERFVSQFSGFNYIDCLNFEIYEKRFRFFVIIIRSNCAGVCWPTQTADQTHHLYSLLSIYFFFFRLSFALFWFWIFAFWSIAPR